MLHNSKPAEADVYVLQIDLSGDQQVPAVSTHVYGFVRFFFNDDRSEADYTVDIKGIDTSNVLGADMYRGAPGVNGPVIFNLHPGGFIASGGHMRFSEAALAEMATGNWYVSFRTTSHPQGEIRGQIILPADFFPAAAAASNPAPSQPPVAPPPLTLTQAGGVRPPNTGDAGLAH